MARITFKGVKKQEMTQMWMKKKFITRKQIHKAMVLTFMDTKCKNIFLFFVSNKNIKLAIT